MFEINTGAMTRGYRTSPYPRPFIIKELVKSGAGITLGSDCHDKNYIDCFFVEAKQLLLAAGFTSKFVITENGFSEVVL